MFSNVEQLLPINRELLRQIEERVRSWNDTQRIGDVFKQMAPFLKMYNAYGNNYERAVETYYEARKGAILHGGSQTMRQ